MYLILREASFCRGWWLIQAHNGSTCWKLVTMACPIINGTFTSNLLPWTLGKHHGRRQSIGDIQRLWKAAAKYYLLVMMQLLRSWTPWWLWLPTKDLHKIEPLKTPSWTGGRGFHPMAQASDTTRKCCFTSIMFILHHWTHLAWPVSIIAYGVRSRVRTFLERKGGKKNSYPLLMGM